MLLLEQICKLQKQVPPLQVLNKEKWFLQIDRVENVVRQD
jgi:hypothetical protein